MEVKEAILTAKRYVAQVLEDEDVQNIGLEEIRYDEDEGVWNITVGFSRPWNSVKNLLSSTGLPKVGRSYRVVKIRDSDGRPLSFIRREEIPD